MPLPNKTNNDDSTSTPASAAALRMARRASTIKKSSENAPYYSEQQRKVVNPTPTTKNSTNSSLNKKSSQSTTFDDQKHQTQQQDQEHETPIVSPTSANSSSTSTPVVGAGGNNSASQRTRGPSASKSFIALNRKKAALTPAKTAAATAAKEWKNWEVEPEDGDDDDGGGDYRDGRKYNNGTGVSGDEDGTVEILSSNDDADIASNQTSGSQKNQNFRRSSSAKSAGSTGIVRKSSSASLSSASAKDNSSDKRKTHQQQQQSDHSKQQQKQQHQITLRRRYRGQAAKLKLHDADDANNNNNDDDDNNDNKFDENGNSLLKQSSSSAVGFQRTVENAASLVARSPLFTTLRDRRVIDRIAHTVRWCSAMPGQYIVVAGDVATSMYFIFSGYVEILLPVSDEEETPVATLQGGDFFGEIALVSKEQTLRTASVQAAKHCELLVLSRSDLEEVIAVSDELRECLELEANKRLASLKQREQKLLRDEVDVDRELLRRAAQNPLSAIECEWRLLSKARIRGSHRTHPPPVLMPDVMAWARHHAQHTPWPFHGRTTSALANLPSSVVIEETSSTNPQQQSEGTDENTSSRQHLLLLHPEMGCVYKYSTVIDSLAGPDEFENLCRSVARVLADNIPEGNALSKQAIGSLGLAAQVALFFSHSGKRKRLEFLMDHVTKRIDRDLSRHERAELSLSRDDGLPTFVIDQNMLSEMTAGLFRAPCWSISTQLIYDQYPKSFVLSDAWAVVTLERLASLREECIKRASEIVVDQMIERHIFIVRKWKAEREILGKHLRIRKMVIKKAMTMLVQVEAKHRERVERDYETESAGLWRWHECCLSFVSSQRSAQESALADHLEKNSGSMYLANNRNNNYTDDEFGINSSGGPSQRRATSSSASSRGGRMMLGSGNSSSSRAASVFFGGSHHHHSNQSRARSGGVSSSRGRNGLALLVAQKERMADEAVYFQKRVKQSRF